MDFGWVWLGSIGSIAYGESAPSPLRKFVFYHDIRPSIWSVPRFQNHCFYYVYTPLTMARIPLQSILSQLQNQRFPYLQNQRPTVLIYSMNVLLLSPAPGLSRATFLGTYSTLPLSPDLLPLAPQKSRFNIKAWCAAPKRKFSLPDAAKFHA